MMNDQNDISLLRLFFWVGQILFGDVHFDNLFCSLAKQAAPTAQCHIVKEKKE